ncbi:Nce101p [Sporobolomyces salmoneus]|uniref:Nce101p n=1 Tax=Sporobolomyces salmoneus TaxID=183962 RepID=UPI00316D5D21
MSYTIPSRIYLISKWGDVALGLSTGVFAYYLYEKKLHRTEEDSLLGLIRWKSEQRQKLKAASATADVTSGGEWEELTKELGKETK